MLDAAPPPISFPPEGIRRGDLLYRLPTSDDVEVVAPAFLDEEVAGLANMPRLSAHELRVEARDFPAMLRDGVFLPLLEAARGRGIAARTARFLADHGFSLGAERVEARVFVGNAPSERVLERAGFRREGLLRSPPGRSGRRVDMSVRSLLPGE